MHQAPGGARPRGLLHAHRGRSAVICAGSELDGLGHGEQACTLASARSVGEESGIKVLAEAEEDIEQGFVSAS